MGLKIPDYLVGHIGLEKAQLMHLKMDLEMPKYIICLDLGLDGLPGGPGYGLKRPACLVAWTQARKCLRTWWA